MTLRSRIWNAGLQGCHLANDGEGRQDWLWRTDDKDRISVMKQTLDIWNKQDYSCTSRLMKLVVQDKKKYFRKTFSHGK